MKTGKVEITSFICFGVFIHLILLCSIFEIYYSSPLVIGSNNFPITNGKAPASRLLFISADGLRWRSFFEHPEKSPFLHKMMDDGKAAWGPAQSHVPTESRTGHVALMAGFYEDVSAVARGWRYNPVEFDSMANRTSYLWMWGSQDVTQLFADAKNSNLVHWDYYSGDNEDFASNNAHLLDTWVFDKVETYFTNKNITNKIFAEKSLFFLHLLGLDTNGHGAKPHSQKYLDNIRVVDDGIRRTMELFQRIYSDDRTAFIFTADHGMTDWGAHGSGSDDEIYVPFVAWGAGIRSSALRFSSPIKQVDIAPLQAALLGTAIPVNSVGVLPLSFLNTTSAYRFKAAYANFKQMTEQYSIKRKERQTNSLPYMFRDYGEFSPSALARINSEINRLAELRRFDAAAMVSIEWVPRLRNALIYFHRYKRFSLGLAITALYASWNLLVYYYITSRRAVKDKKSSFTFNAVLKSIFLPNLIFKVLLSIGITLIGYQRLPLTNYVYYLMPLYTLSIIWNFIVKNSSNDSNLKAQYLIATTENYFMEIILMTDDRLSVVRRLLFNICTFCFGGFMLLIFVSTFYERRVLSIMYMFLSPLWWIPEWEGEKSTHPDAMKWKWIWTLSCLSLCVFPLLDTIGNTPRPLLTIAAPFLGYVVLSVYLIVMRTSIFKQNSRIIPIIQLFYIVAGCLQMFNLLFTNMIFTLILRCFSWSSLAISLLLPLFETINSHNKQSDVSATNYLVIWMASLFLPYSMLTVAYESIFLLNFCVFLFTLYRLEFGHLSDFQVLSLTLNKGFNSSKCGTIRHCQDKGSFSPAEWRRAALIVAVVEMAFFGTGNIASLNTFNTSSIRNFVTVFSPFLMAILLFSKILIPFFQMSMAFSAILAQSSEDALLRLSALMMFITDAMAVVFFYNLKDDGSWLDIGISNYVICVVSSISVFILLHVANSLLHFRLYFRTYKGYL